MNISMLQLDLSFISSLAGSKVEASYSTQIHIFLWVLGSFHVSAGTTVVHIHSIKIHIFLFQTSISTNNAAHSKRQVSALNTISTFTNATPVTGGMKQSALYVPRYVTLDMLSFTMDTLKPPMDVIVEEEEMNRARH